VSEPRRRALVSVIIPTYNRHKSVTRAILSVLPQLADADEVIVVDDGSTDGTVDQLAQWGESRLRVILSGGRMGPAAARNAGIRVARGEFLVFLDSDDEWLHGRLSRALDVLDDNPVAVAVGCGCSCPEDDSRSYYFRAACAPVVQLVRQLPRQVPGVSCWAVRADAARSVGGFSEAISRFEDWEFVLKLSSIGSVFFIGEPLVLYHRSSDSLLADESGYVTSLSAILQRHKALFDQYPRARASYSNLIGQTLCQQGEMTAGRHWFLRALKDAPTNLRAWSNLLMSVCGRWGFRVYVIWARKMRASVSGPVDPRGLT